MASIFKNPIYVIGGLCVLGAVVFALQPDEPSKSAKPVAKKSTTTTKTDSVIQPVDYTVHFDPIGAKPKDLFKPLVAKKAATVVSAPGGGGGIPPSLTGGEGTWFYTGNATVDGATTALVENQTTGDFVYLKSGEKWKDCTVAEIDDDKLVLVGEDEIPVSVNVKQDAASTAQKPIGGTSITGPIGGGNGMSLVPDDGSGAVVDTSGGNTNGGGRRRGRRGRGGFGGGGG